MKTELKKYNLLEIEVIDVNDDVITSSNGFLGEEDSFFPGNQSTGGSY